MRRDVFISYAHATAHAEARAARDAFEAEGLGVFFDERVIPPGSPFPREIADALLGARAVLVFADENYFGREWCIREFQVAVAPYRAAHAPEEAALEHVVVALPAGGSVAKLAAHLPPPLARGSWPHADQAANVVALVKSRLATLTRTLGERLEGLDDPALRNLREGGAVPNPSTLGGAASYLKELPDSLKERFVGRTEELWRVFHVLETRRAEGGARACVLQGLGGVGKSQLAAEYVWRYGAGHYPGGLVWINADCDEDTLLAQFASVLNSFGADAPTLASAGDDRRRWRDALSTALESAFGGAGRKGAVLWVVDNVPGPTKNAPQQPLKHWCPPRNFVSSLFTTRGTGLKDADSFVPLEELPIGAAVELLTQPEVKRAWLGGEEWEEVARWVGCLPLALRVLQTSLGDGFLGTKELLAKTRGEEPAAALDAEVEALSDEVPAGYLRGVAEAFHVSHESLADTPGASEAAHAIARLPARPLPEELLAFLAPRKVTGVLARRGWIQSAEQEGEDGGGASRRWGMHRVAASYLRGAGRDAGADFVVLLEWLERVYSSDPPPPLVATVRPHARVIFLRFAEWLAHNPQADPRYAARAEEFGTWLATWRLADFKARGERFIAANFVEWIGAGERLAERLGELFEDADEETAKNIAGGLHGIQNSPRAAQLLARIFGDPRDQVRWQALLVAPGSYRADVLAVPLLEAIMAEKNDNVRENATLGYEEFLKPPSPVLRGLLSHFMSYRDPEFASPQQRATAVKLLGRVLAIYGDQLEAGGWRSTHVRNALLHSAFNDPDPSVVEVAARALGTHGDDEAHAALAKALAEAGDRDARLRAIDALGWFLLACDATPVAKVRQVEKDGELSLVIDMGKSKQRRPELFEPLAPFALQTEDAEVRERAARALLSTNTGPMALVNASYQLLERREYERLIELANFVGGLKPDFVSAYWWRAQALEATGKPDEALADYTRVIEIMPQFADAFERRARLLYSKGEREAALRDLEAAAALVPGDAGYINFKACVLLSLERNAEAIEAATEAIRLDAQLPSAYMYRSDARGQEGDVPGALADAERACELDPANESALKWRDYLREVMKTVGGG